MRLLPARELQAIVEGLRIDIDRAKRIDPPAQVARALVCLPEARDPSCLPATAQQLLHRIVEARGVLRVEALPSAVEIRGKWIDIDYDLEDRPDTDSAADGAEGMIPVARLRLPEKLARTLSDAELPELDRPLRFIVTRGQRGAVRASTLGELQELLDRPWSPEEQSRQAPGAERGRRGPRRDDRRHRDVPR